MTLEEAIKILTLDKTCDFEGDADDLEKAVQLGIDGLELIKVLRVRYGPAPQFDLPSETKV